MLRVLISFAFAGGSHPVHPTLLFRVQRRAEAAREPRPHGAVEQRAPPRAVIPQAQEEDDVGHAGLAAQVGDGERLVRRVILAGEELSQLSLINNHLRTFITIGKFSDGFILRPFLTK